MHCLSCEYDLQNLAEHRCPECGREFDPNDESTFDRWSHRRRDSVIGIVAIIFAISAIVAALVFGIRAFIVYGP